MKLSLSSAGAGPNLVLLHGWGMNRAIWSNLLPRLTRQFRVTLMELPGHGASEYDPQRRSLDDWAGACMEAAPRHADWIGWSLGGQLAQRIALRFPERVGRLILVCSSPCFIRAAGWPNAMIEQTLKQFALTLRNNHRQTLLRFLSLQVQGDEQARETLRLMRQEMELRPPPDPRALEHGLDLLLRVDLREQLAGLRCRSLWLFGKRDTLVPAAVAGDLKRLNIPAARFQILDGCAHAPFISHPEQSMAALNGFFRSADG